MSTTVKGARRVKRRAPGWSFIAPYTIVLILFGLIPVGYAIVTAFVVTPVVGPTYLSPIDNFVAVLTDYRLSTAALNVAKYLLIWLPLLLVVVFGVALVLDAKRTKFAMFTRFVSYIPGAVTGAAAALLWLFMFTPTVSPVGFLLGPLVGSNGSTVSDSTLPIILAVMGIAIGAGGWIVMLFGALTALPEELIEAAKIDGANAWQQVWHVKLPMVRSYIAFVLIVSLASGFQVFVEPQVLGAGARGQISTTWSVNQLVYSYAAGESNYGRTSALSIVLLAITVTAAVIVITKTRFYSIEGRS